MPNRSTSHREVEHKFTVAEDFQIPDLVSAGVVSGWRPSEVLSLRAVYYDTEDLRLIRSGITLRRREGGPDEGWHVKLPISTARAWEREEIRLPLADFVPAELADIVMPVTRGGRLEPQATVLTQRTPLVVVDGSGNVRAEIVDDRVEVRSPSGRVVTFRELEVEAVDPATDTTVMEAIAEAFLAQGARPSTLSKAAGVLGPRAQLPPDLAPLPMPGPQGVVGDAVVAALAGYARHLVIADIGVRRDIPDAAHQVRVACRRLRSALRVFGSLFDPAVIDPLREELAWLAGELGPWRDTEVIAERLGRSVTEVGADPDVVAYLTQHFSTRLGDARISALAALRSDRHNLLLDDLVDLVRSPPLVPPAFLPVSEVLPAMVWKTWRALRRAVDDLDPHGPAETWHATRIRAKRARYAADIAAAVYGESVSRFAVVLSEVTDTLGEHQDAHVAQTVLYDLADRPNTSTLAPPPTSRVAFTLGRMHAMQEADEARARHAFREAWPAARKAARRSGLAP